MDSANKNASSSNQEVQNVPTNNNAHLDPQRLRRMMMNREYSRRCSQKKTQYMHQLERTKDEEELKLVFLAREIAEYQEKNSALQAENAQLKERIATVEDKSSKLAENIVKLETEKQRLLYSEMLRKVANAEDV